MRIDWEFGEGVDSARVSPQELSAVAIPKGPSRTTNTTRSKFSTCSKFTIAPCFAIVVHP